MLTFIVFLVQSITSASAFSRKLERSSEFKPIRISYITLSGYFGEGYESELKTRILPSGVEFFASAVQINQLKSQLKPSKSQCGDMQIPSAYMSESYDSDILIYLHTNTSISWPMFGKYCEREEGEFKRPLTGHIAINLRYFFNLQPSLQIQYLIRETSHVLALDFDLFGDYVRHNGDAYSPHQYSIRINYVNRGKTVRAIAFPSMLAKARESFNCHELEGLEYEDFFEAEGHYSETFFWDARIMPQDILSSVMTTDVIFSDITLALFEDSGWYKVDFSFSYKIKVGWKAGCRWHEEKCILFGDLNLPGFCDQPTELDQCDSLALGYGECYITQHESIPPHEVYLFNAKLGGKEAYDYCPTILVPEINRCRDSTSTANNEIGEIRGSSSRCFKNTLSKSSGNNPSENSEPEEGDKRSQGGCYRVDSCNEKFLKISAGSTSIDCPYGSRVSLPGYSGHIYCPDSFEFCQSLPCLNLCSGKGQCHEGKCYCSPRWGGEDCSSECPENCSSCKTTGECSTCSVGFVLGNNKTCIPCDPQCLTCAYRPNQCLSCEKGKELVGSKCLASCLENCATCDNPCTKCDSGFYLTSGKCSPCDENCKECAEDSKICTACQGELVIINGTCKTLCIEGCFKCENPCSKCKEGFLLDNGECIPCDNICKECFNTTSTCSKCFTGYLLEEASCVQGCKENCQSCDDPCSVCEDGFFETSGNCSSCSDNCLTCSNNQESCSSCKSGYVLKGATCVKDCLDDCETCGYPCKKCSAGFFIEQGFCAKCSSNCKTCEFESTKCSSCFDGFGLIQNSCKLRCADHCLSCDAPCTKCDQGFFVSSGSCFKCDQACVSCYADGPDHCQTCAFGYKKLGETCKQSCPDNCLTCDEPCSICARGYYLLELGCSKCPSSCSVCKSETICTDCISGFFLVENTCKKNCLPHCSSCTTPCTECEKGFFLFDGTCLQCDSNCLTCKDMAHSCTSCPTGSSLIINYCKTDCVKNCLTCEFPCLACEANYASIDGKCQRCPLGCLSCDENLEKCYACQHGFEFSDYKCSKICLSHCSSCDEPCSTCDSGYLSVKGFCLPCLIPCRSCISSVDVCTSCISGYYLDDSTCKNLCGDYCLSCDFPCSHCEDGFVSIQGYCEACSQECRTCQENQNFCTSCGLGLHLEDGKCLKICIENCADCSFPCTSCKPGYEAKDEGTQCSKCINYLAKDQVFAEFLKDFTGISLIFSFPVLQIENECEKYFKSFTLSMLGRRALCSWVNSQKLVVAFGFNPDLQIQSLEMFPITVLGNDCSKPSSDLSIKILTTQISPPFSSISAPDMFTIGCSNDVLVIQCFTSEKSFQITVSSSPESSLDTEYIDYLHGKILVIPEAKLQESVITVTLTSKNFFEKTSTCTKQIHVQKNQHILTFIDTGSQMRIKSSESLKIRGMISENHCIDPGHLSFSWSYIEFNEVPFESGKEIVNISRVPNVLSIPRGSLPAGRSYLFRFSVISTQDSLEKVSFSEVVVDVVEEPVVVQLDRSDSSHSINEELRIQASTKHSSGIAKTKRFEWKCLENNEVCLDEFGKSLIENEMQKELVIKPYKMKAGRFYHFSVKVTSGDQIGFQSVMITASNAQGTIKIPNFVSPVNIGEKFEVFPEFLVRDDLSMKWSQTRGPAVQTSSKSEDPFLIIDKNEMVSGRMYEFSLSNGTNDSIIFSKVTWVTNTGPKCGGFTSLVQGNSVTLAIECEDRDLHDDVLTYVYGVKQNSAFFPLRVVHSPSTTFKLRANLWTVFVTVCDSLNSCITKENKVTVTETNKDILYKAQRLYPENLPTAILNSADSFNKNNFLSTLNDLQHYILSQELDLVHLKMSIECLEILTSSNKTHFMKNHQKEITQFLTRIVSGIKRIDTETMKYVIDLLSQHEIRHYQLTSKLLNVFSFKWAGNMPPGESLLTGSGIQLKRVRFVGGDMIGNFSFSSLNISGLRLNVKRNIIYDLVIIVYPASPFPIVDVSYFDVGFYRSFNFKLKDSPLSLVGELAEPFYIDYPNVTKGDFMCLQLRGGVWIDEGCNFETFNKSYARLTSWHLSMYSIVDSGVTRIGYSAIITVSVILVLTIFLVTLFCLVDKSKSPLMHPDYQVLSTQRDQVEFEIVEGEKVPIERKRPSLEELRPTETPIITYHPTLNIFKPQTGDRRAASVLHLSAVILSEFAIIGGMFHPKLNKVFDDDGKFLKFSTGQVIFLCIGIVVSQQLSGCLMYLNGVNDLELTNRYIGISLSCLTILITSCASMILAISYPAILSFYWVACFCCFLVVEVLIFETLLWLVNTSAYKKDNERELSRNVRVFTTDS